MVNGEDGGGHEPRKTHDGADHDQDGQDQQVQVVAAPFLNSTHTHTQLLFRHFYYKNIQESKLTGCTCQVGALAWLYTLHAIYTNNFESFLTFLQLGTHLKYTAEIIHIYFYVIHLEESIKFH